jgi:hypothetical protein
MAAMRTGSYSDTLLYHMTHDMVYSSDIMVNQRTNNVIDKLVSFHISCH